MPSLAPTSHRHRSRTAILSVALRPVTSTSEVNANKLLSMDYPLGSSLTRTEVLTALSVPLSAGPHLVSFSATVTLTNGQKYMVSNNDKPIVIAGGGNETNTGAGLSTNPDETLRKREEVILGQIAQNFPVDTTHDWYNLLGSSAHHSATGTYAADLNFGDVLDDQGTPIYAVAPGTVNRLYFYQGKQGPVSILVIRHAHPSGGTWDSVYMHMPMRAIAGGKFEMLDKDGRVIITLGEGDRIDAAHTQIGTVGDMGAPGAYHLHFEAHTGIWRGTEQIPGAPAINLDRLFALPSLNAIETKINEAGAKNYLLSFDAGLQEWVNNSDKIVAHSMTLTGADGKPYGEVVMRAWESNKNVGEMERVVYINISSPDAPVKRWIKANNLTNDPKDVWDPVSQDWITRTAAVL